MARTKAATPPMPLPTFAACDLDCWDEDADEPDEPSPYDLEDEDVMAGAKAAVGEDLKRYSADIVKLVGLRARRTLKSLPTPSDLLAMAEKEQDRRWRQLLAYRDALCAHERAIAKGTAEATRIAERAAAAGLQPLVDVGEILRMHELITSHPLGIQYPYSGVPWRWRVARALLHRMEQGEHVATVIALHLLAAKAAYEALSEEEQDEAWAEHDAIVAELGAHLGLPKGPGDW